MVNGTIPTWMLLQPALSGPDLQGWLCDGDLGRV